MLYYFHYYVESYIMMESLPSTHLASIVLEFRRITKKDLLFLAIYAASQGPAVGVTPVLIPQYPFDSTISFWWYWKQKWNFEYIPKFNCSLFVLLPFVIINSNFVGFKWAHQNSFITFVIAQICFSLCNKIEISHLYSLHSQLGHIICRWLIVLVD